LNNLSALVELFTASQKDCSRFCARLPIDLVVPHTEGYRAQSVRAE